jgi:hypothetical protein
MLGAECERDKVAAGGEVVFPARCDPFLEALVENVPPRIASSTANNARVMK